MNRNSLPTRRGLLLTNRGDKVDTLTIDKELQQLIPPLTADEYKGLEEDILRDGVREPLIVWAGHNVLVDGHNRYRIATEHGIPFGVFEKSFKDKCAVIDWMVRNQKNRRNLTPGQRSALELDASEAKLREEARLKQAKAGGDRKSEDYKANIASDQLVGSDIASEIAPCETSSKVKPVTKIAVPQKHVKNREEETPHKIAKRAGVGEGTVKRVMAVKHSGDAELYDKVRSGEISANKAYEEVKARKQQVISADIERGQAIIRLESGLGKTESCDLLITEVPEDLAPNDWLYTALSGVRRSGHAYVFITPSPKNLSDYINASIPVGMELAQVLVWSFDYIVGNNDWSRYKPSWKAILYYRGADASDLRFPYLKERNAVHSINAEGGETGKREFELRMPIELAKRLISQSTKEGDLVFDPFAKYGAFLIGAMEIGRDAIGYETNELMVAEAIKKGCVRR